MTAGDDVKAGIWYDLYASAEYEKTSDATVLTLGVKPSLE